jgi:hypothetical protein
MLHIVSLAKYAAVHTRGWAAESARPLLCTFHNPPENSGLGWAAVWPDLSPDIQAAILRAGVAPVKFS